MKHSSWFSLSSQIWIVGGLVASNPISVAVCFAMAAYSIFQVMRYGVKELREGKGNDNP